MTSSEQADMFAPDPHADRDARLRAWMRASFDDSAAEFPDRDPARVERFIEGFVAISRPRLP
jgi:hypothetical protein